MSSNFNFEQVRKYYQDPKLAKINDIAKRLAKQESDSGDIEKDDLVGLGRSRRTKIKHDDRWTFGKSFTSPTVSPQLVFEPDFTNLLVDLKFDHMGSQITDYSGFGNLFEVVGEPCPSNGPAVPFRGGNKNNVGWSIEKDVYAHCESAFSDITDNTVGFSIWTVLNFRTIDADENGFQQRIFEQRADSNNAVSLRVGTEGTLIFLVEKGGVDTLKITADGIISPNTDYQIVATFATSGNVSHLYVNNVDKTLSNTGNTIPDPAGTNDPVLFARIGGIQDGGRADLNSINNFRWYDQMVLNSTQVGNLFNTKFTISSATNPMILDGCVFGSGATKSYTTTSFTTTSYTAG